MVLVKTTVIRMKSPGKTSETGVLVNNACTSIPPLVVEPMPNFRAFGLREGVGFQVFEELSW
jgi:hypothetical protein